MKRMTVASMRGLNPAPAVTKTCLSNVIIIDVFCFFLE